jgi:hypothetical protein
MVEDARTAERVLELADNRNRQLVESLGPGRTGCPHRQYEAYRAGIAQRTGPVSLRRQPDSIGGAALISAATLRASVSGWPELGRNQRDH